MDKNFLEKFPIGLYIKRFKNRLIINNYIGDNNMADEDKRFSRQIMGKTVVSKSGKRFGEVGDMIFESKSGELIHMVLVNPTPYTEKLDLEKDKEGHLLIPFSAVVALGDYMVIAEEDII